VACGRTDMTKPFATLRTCRDLKKENFRHSVWTCTRLNQLQTQDRKAVIIRYTERHAAQLENQTLAHTITPKFNQVSAANFARTGTSHGATS